MAVFSDSKYRVSKKKHVNLVTTFTSSLFHTHFFVHAILELVDYDRMNSISNEQSEKWDFNVLNRRKLCNVYWTQMRYPTSQVVYDRNGNKPSELA